MSTKKVKVELLFGANTQAAEAELKKLSDSLERIRNRPPIGAGDLGFQKAAEAAEWLERSLRSAVDVNTGKLNLNKFTQDLNLAGRNLEILHQELRSIGPDGEHAFKQLAKSIALADTATLTVNDKLKEVFKTLKNTARWEISSKVLHGLESALSNSYRYAQDLNKSLNDIRIVTGYNTDQMAKFAKEANNAAKALSSTTTDYTKASLIYYQQGLSDSEVVERTNTTIKMSQVAGSTAEKASEQLTAVWNNFYDGTKSLEYYADVMTALGAATASSTDEISTGLNKFASVANTVGLSYEYAASALATVTATTRESADVVGTAFKTLFARIQDLELGNTLDDGTTLGKYSQSLAKVGIDIKDVNGEIKDMDILLNEIAKKWQTLSNGDRMALAQNVAGTRQYTQLMALMNNWEFFQDNLNTSLTSEGALNEQAEIYTESWEAAEKRVTASAEAIYSKILDDEAFIELTNLFADFIDFTGKLIDGLGGVQGLLTTIGTIFVAKFAKDVPEFMRKTINNFKVITGLAEKEKIAMIQDSTAILHGGWKDKKQGTYNKNKSDLTEEDQRLVDINNITLEYLKNKKYYSEAQQKEYEDRIKNLKALHEETKAYKLAADEAKKSAEAKKQAILKEYKQNPTTGQGITLENNLLKLTNEKLTLQKYNQKQRNKVYATLDDGTQITVQQRLDQLEQEIPEAKQKLEEFNQSLINTDQLTQEATKALNNLGTAIQNNVKASSNLTIISRNIDFLIEDEDIKELEEYKRLIEDILNKSTELDLTRDTVTGLQKAMSENSIIDIKTALQNTKNSTQGDYIDTAKYQENEALAEQEAQNYFKTSQINAYSEQVRTGAQADAQHDAKKYRWKVKTNKATEFPPPKTLDKVAKGLTIATSAATGAVAAFSAVNGVWETMEDTSATTGEKITALGGGLMSLIPTITSLIATMGPWGIAIAAIGAAVAVGVKLWDNYTVTAEEKLEAAKERAEEFAQASDEAANKAEDIANAYENYTTVLDTLNSCTQGTTEWKNALEDVKNQAQALIDMYPELLKMSDLWVYDEATGEYIINPETLDKAKKEAEKEAQIKQISEDLSNIEVQQSDLDLIIENREKAGEIAYHVATKGLRNQESTDFILSASNSNYKKTDNSTGNYYAEFIAKAKEAIAADASDEDIIDLYNEAVLSAMNQINANAKMAEGYGFQVSKDIIAEKSNLKKNELNTFINYLREEVKAEQNIPETIQNQALLYAQSAMGANNEYGSLFLTKKLSDSIQTELDLDNIISDWRKGIDFKKNTIDENSDLNNVIKAYAEENGYVWDQSINYLRNAGNGKIVLQNVKGKGEHIALEELAEWDRSRKIYANLKEDSDAYKQAEAIQKAVSGLSDQKDKDLALAILQEQAGQNTEAIEDYFRDYKGPIQKFDSWFEDFLSNFDESIQSIFNESQVLAQQAYNQVIGTLSQEAKLGSTITTRQNIVDQKIDSNIKDSLSIGVQNDFAVAYEKLYNTNADLAEIFNSNVLNSEEAVEQFTLFSESITNLAYAATHDGAAALNKMVDNLKLVGEDAETARQAIEDIFQIGDISSSQAEAKAKTINEIVGSGLVYGDILTDAEIDTLEDYGLEVKEYFDILEDGTWKLTGGFKNADKGITGLNKGISEFNKTIKESTFNDYKHLLTEYDKSVEEAKEEAKNSTIEGINDAQEENLALLRGLTKESLTEAGVDVATQALIESGTTIDENGNFAFNGDVITKWTEEQWKQIADARALVNQKDQNNQLALGQEAYDYASLEALKEERYLDQPVYDYLRLLMEKQAEDFEFTKFEEIVDVYADIADQLNRINNELNRTSKEADNAYGAKRIKALRQMNDLYEEQTKYLKNKQGIIDNNLKDSKNQLIGLDILGNRQITFDENGLVNNQVAIQEAYYDEINRLQTLFEQSGADEKNPLNAQIEALRKEYEEIERVISQYEGYFQDNIDNLNAIEDSIYAKMDNKYEEINYTYEINLELNDKDLQLLETRLEQYKDNFYKLAEGLAYIYNGSQSGDQYGEYIDNLAEIETRYNDITEARKNGEITQQKYIEGLNNSFEGVMNNIKSLQELDDTMIEYYANTLSKAEEELGKWNERLENSTAILDHYKNIMSTLGKETDYRNMGAILKGQSQTIKNELNAAKGEYEIFAEEARKAQENLANATDEAEKEQFKKEWEAAEKAAREAQDRMLQKTQDWAEAMKETISNELAGLGKELEKALTGGKSFDEMSTALEHASSLQEEYLTSTNQIYETTKLMRTAQNAIDATTNSVAKQKLQNFINETKQLQNQTKLSKYELDIQQKKYDLVLAEIALKDAQNAKTTVRLTRDAEGNFGYIYTADQNKVNDAQQKFEDAQNTLYNIGLEGANDYVQKYQQTMNAMYDELTALQEAYLNGEITTQEEYNRRQNEIQQYYYQKLKDYSSLYQVALTTDSRVVADAWSSDFADMTYETEDWMNYVDEYVTHTKDVFIDWQQTIDEIEQYVNADFENMETAVKDVTNESDKLADELENDVQNAISTTLKEVGTLTTEYAKHRDEIRGMIEDYIDLAQVIRDAIAAQDVFEGASSSSEEELPADLSMAMAQHIKNNGTTQDTEYQNYSEARYKKVKELNISPESTTQIDHQTLEELLIAYEVALRKGNTTTDVYKYVESVLKEERYFNSDEARAAMMGVWNPKRFASGGYTGSWGPEGKLAILDEKELVLNSSDTANFLASLDLLHDIIRMIDIQAANAQTPISLFSTGLDSHNTTIEQSVHIEANFPSVTDRTELEEAFTNLINKASQYANRKI